MFKDLKTLLFVIGIGIAPSGIASLEETEAFMPSLSPAGQTPFSLSERIEKALRHFISEEYEQSAACFCLLAEEGNSLGQFFYGLQLLDGVGIRKNPGAAFQLLQLAKDSDVLPEDKKLQSRYLIAGLLLEGKYVDKDSAEAVRLLREGAKQNHKNSLVKLGTFLLEGDKVVNPNIKEGKEYLKAASHQGDGWASFVLACAYRNGWGGKMDFKKAFTYFEKGNNQGESYATFYLGMSYLEGEGVDVHPDLAYPLILKAADQGMPDAEYAAGFMYENGEGVESDIAMAQVYYARAAEKGDLRAKDDLERIRSVTEEEKTKAAKAREAAKKNSETNDAIVERTGLRNTDEECGEANEAEQS